MNKAPGYPPDQLGSRAIGRGLLATAATFSFSSLVLAAAPPPYRRRRRRRPAAAAGLDEGGHPAGHPLPAQQPPSADS